MFLLTDGTVIVQDLGSTEAGSPNWWRLAPDSSGSYVDGTWSRLASLPAAYAPNDFAAAVLPDGRLAVAGGEYNNSVRADTNRGAIYDPLKNTWTTISPPAGGAGDWAHISDAPGVVLADGRWMVGASGSAKADDDAILDPATLTWTTTRGRGRIDANSEAGFTLLPSGKVLSVDVKNKACTTRSTEIFDPASLEWSTAGKTPTPLVACGAASEIGPQVLTYSGQVFVEGATSATALYDATSGTWSSGPAFPIIDGQQVNAGDAGSALLPDGKVLVSTRTGVFLPPTHFLLFDGTSFSRAPDTATSAEGGLGYMLVLPTGQVLYNGPAELEIFHGSRRAEPDLGAAGDFGADPARRGIAIHPRRTPAQRAFRGRRLRRRLSVQLRLSAGADHQRRHRSSCLRAHLGHDEPVDRTPGLVLHELHAPGRDRDGAV